jgi:hypothetical protein
MKFILALTFCCLSIAAFAEPPTSVDMTTPIMDQNGQSVPDMTDRAPDDKECNPQQRAKCPPLTVGHLVSLALNGAYEDEKSLGWQQRFDRSALAKRIKDDKAAVLDSTETAAIERLLGKAGINGNMLYQVIEVIDPNAKAGKVQ